MSPVTFFENVPVDFKVVQCCQLNLRKCHVALKFKGQGPPPRHPPQKTACPPPLLSPPYTTHPLPQPHTLPYRDGYRISERGGGPRNCSVLKRGPFACMRATFFPLCMKFGGAPKGVPPVSAPGLHTTPKPPHTPSLTYFPI